MSYVIEHHRAVADPFGEGDQAAHLGTMMTLTDGFDWPWRTGGAALLRRALYPEVHDWIYCGLAAENDTQIKSFPGMAHDADQAYQYTAVVFLGNGMISAMAEPVRLDFDGAGALISPGLPNFPLNPTAEEIDGGKFIIRWYYSAWGQGGPPKDFQVFEGPDAGSVDYNAPLVDSVTGLNYVKAVGGNDFTFTTAAFADGTEHVFGVRARNASGVAEKNTFTTAKRRARGAAPAPAPKPERIVVRSYGSINI